MIRIGELGLRWQMGLEKLLHAFKRKVADTKLVSEW